jgi:hypothetical protein
VARFEDPPDEDEDDVEESEGDEAAIDARMVDGVDPARSLIKKRLEKAIASPDVERRLQIRLLQKIKTGVGETPVDAFVHSFDDDVEETTDAILKSAVDDCMQHTGTVRYLIRIRGQDKATNFELYRQVTAEDSSYREGGSPYAGTALGVSEAAVDVIGHLGRLLDGFAKQVGVAGRREVDVIMVLLKDRETELRMYKAREFERMREFEELQSMSFARQLELQKLEKDLAQREAILSMVKMLAPALLAQRGIIAPEMAQMLTALMTQMDQQPPAGQPQAPNPFAPQPPPAALAPGAADEGRAWADDFRTLEATLNAMPEEVAGGLHQALMANPAAFGALLRMKQRADRAIGGAPPPPPPPQTNGVHAPA